MGPARSRPWPSANPCCNRSRWVSSDSPSASRRPPISRTSPRSRCWRCRPPSTVGVSSSSGSAPRTTPRSIFSTSPKGGKGRLLKAGPGIAEAIRAQGPPLGPDEPASGSGGGWPRRSGEAEIGRLRPLKDAGNMTDVGRESVPECVQHQVPLSPAPPRRGSEKPSRPWDAPRGFDRR